MCNLRGPVVTTGLSEGGGVVPPEIYKYEINTAAAMIVIKTHVQAISLVREICSALLCLTILPNNIKHGTIKYTLMFNHYSIWALHNAKVITNNGQILGKMALLKRSNVDHLHTYNIKWVCLLSI